MRLLYYLSKTQAATAKLGVLFSIILLFVVVACQTKGPKIKDVNTGMLLEKGARFHRLYFSREAHTFRQVL